MENNKYKISLSLTSAIWTEFLRIINRALIFLGLRKTRKYYGIVYDSVTKQPLDPAIVKLVYSTKGVMVETVLTDLSGRYGFLARPGKFKILVRKANYVFPSKIVRGDSDGVYDDLYHGEFFELTDDSEVVAPNIPMDPVKPDWNQMDKMKIMNARPYRRVLIKRLTKIFFWFGFIFSGAYFLNDLYKFSFSKNLRGPILMGIGQGWHNLFLAFLLLVFLAAITPRIRLWGDVKISKDKEILPSLQLELNNPLLPGIVMGKANVAEDGKFFLRSNAGKYILHIKLMDKKQTESEKFTLLGTIPVTIPKEGLFSSTLHIN